jgi:hypothetical protein
LRLANSYHWLLGHPNYHNTSGLTLLLHDDDTKISDMDLLKERLQDLPTSDWDVIKFNCRRPPNDQACDRSNVLLWQGSGLSKLRDILHRETKTKRGMRHTDLDIDCLLRAKGFKTYCVDTNSIEYQAVEEPLNVAVTTSSNDMKVSLEEIRNRTSKRAAINDTIAIDRIYYINLEKNSLRRQGMEFMLQQQFIPFKRIPARIGVTDQCAKSANNTNKCRGVSGLARTLVGMLNEENTTGLSLVLQDDLMLTDPGLQRLQESIKMVPDDWDLIRFDCWQTEWVSFNKINKYVIDTRQVSSTIIGFTMVFLWVGSSHYLFCVRIFIFAVSTYGEMHKKPPLLFLWRTA